MFRARYDDVLSSPAQSALYRSTPVAYVWDDPDYGPNDGQADPPSRKARSPRPPRDRAALRAAGRGRETKPSIRHTDQVRTQVVLSLVFAHLMLAYVARARRTTFESGWWRGTVLRRAVAASLALQALLVLMPALGAPLSLTTLPPVGWAMATAVGILTPVLCDVIRPLDRG